MKWQKMAKNHVYKWMYFAISTFVITDEMGLTLNTHTPEKALNIPTRELAPHIEGQQDEVYSWSPLKDTV